MQSPVRTLLFALGLGLSSATHAQPQPVAPPPTNPNPQAAAAPTADECSKPENKAKPDCVKDAGIVRTPAQAADPAFARTPPPTGDAINKPGIAPSDQKKETPR